MKREIGSQNSNRCREVTWDYACAAALMSVALLSSTALAQSGDMNCDGAVNTGDISLFVDALLASDGFGGCDINRADMNADALIDGRDSQAFVAALMTPPCPTCFGGQVCCGGVCREVELDPSNCGTCGHQCGPGETCAGGGCQPAEPCPGC